MRSEGMKRYIAGFLFDDAASRVVLINESRWPDQGAGRWTPIRGQVDPWRHRGTCAVDSVSACSCDGEAPEDAMRRAFLREAGVSVQAWRCLLSKAAADSTADFFYALSTSALDRVRIRDGVRHATEDDPGYLARSRGRGMGVGAFRCPERRLDCANRKRETPSMQRRPLAAHLRADG